MKKRPSIQGMGELFSFPLEPEQPETPSTAPPDRGERERALDVTRSWIVEAPAGSGKTGLLIQRYLKLLALPGVDQPEQVLAITFTVKATGEIRERVLEQLERAAGPDNTIHDFERETRGFALAVLERDRNLGWNLREHPRRLNVRTIDSVCAEIARSLPVLSGSGSLNPTEDASSLQNRCRTDASTAWRKRCRAQRCPAPDPSASRWQPDPGSRSAGRDACPARSMGPPGSARPPDARG